MKINDRNVGFTDKSLFTKNLFLIAESSQNYDENIQTTNIHFFQFHIPGCLFTPRLGGAAEG